MCPVPIDSVERELLQRLVDFAGHKQNSLHAPLPTEPILEIYDKEEKEKLGEMRRWGEIHEIPCSEV